MDETENDYNNENEDNREKEYNRENEHTIFVGGKPFMNYVTGVVMQFSTFNSPEVLVKARGKFIAKAVDIAEVARRRFLENGVDIGNVQIGSEEFTNEEGRNIRVSTIEIVLRKR